MIQFSLFIQILSFLKFNFSCLVLVLMILSYFRLDSAVLDLVADDGAGIQKQRSMYHWDKVILKVVIDL